MVTIKRTDGTVILIPDAVNAAMFIATLESVSNAMISKGIVDDMIKAVGGNKLKGGKE